MTWNARGSSLSEVAERSTLLSVLCRWALDTLLFSLSLNARCSPLFGSADPMEIVAATNQRSRINAHEPTLTNRRLPSLCYSGLINRINIRIQTYVAHSGPWEVNQQYGCLNHIIYLDSYKVTEAVRSQADRSLSFCSYFNRKHLSLHELYLELLKSPSSIFYITIHSNSHFFWFINFLCVGIHKQFFRCNFPCI